jgi:hypothetical protein
MPDNNQNATFTVLLIKAKEENKAGKWTGFISGLLI